MKNFFTPKVSSIFPLAAAILFFAAAPQPARAQQTSGTAMARPNISGNFPRKLIISGVGNAGEATPQLFRGAQPTAEGFANLAKMGVSIVVDLRGGDQQSEREEVTRLGMKFVSIPWYCMFPKDEVVAEFLELLKDNPGEKVFVHCREGIDRTGMMVAAYRMAEEGRTAEQAMQEMQAFGFSFLHHVTCPGLAGYEENFPAAFAGHPAFQGLRASAASHAGASAMQR